MRVPSSTLMCVPLLAEAQPNWAPMTESEREGKEQRKKNREEREERKREEREKKLKKKKR